MKSTFPSRLLLTTAAALLLAAAASAQTLPPGVNLPGNLQLPSGMSPAQVNQLLRELGPAQTPAVEGSGQAKGEEDAVARQQSQRREEARQEVEREESERARDNRDRFREHVDSMVADGELGDEERRFLEVRAADLGVPPGDAQELIAGALAARRKLATYRSYVEAFHADGVIDRTEAELLADKRAALGISAADHRQVLEQVRDEVAGRPVDVLDEIKRAAPPPPDQTAAPYGSKLFRLAPEAFAPPEGLPPPDAYVVGPGDRFQVNLWGRLEAEYALTVDGEGNVLFPQIGPVHLAGLRYAEAREVLRRKAESITGVSAAVVLTRLRSVQVFVVGEAAVPGAVTLSPLSTVVHAVMAAGGPTAIGSLRTVQLRRAGTSLATLDLYQFLQRGEVAGDRPLETGDVVVIPRAERLVTVVGKVRRPAIYSLKAGEGLRELIDGFAGGLTADADGSRLQVARSRDNLTREVLEFDYREAGKDFVLDDGDVVRVFPLKPEVENEVTLYGHVYEPGRRAFTPGMRVGDLIGGADALRPEVDLEYAVVVRETGLERSKTVLPFSLGRVLDGSEPGENLPLEPRDEVYVFSRFRFRPPLRAVVSGQVRRPALYRIEQGARVADLVRLGGGLTAEALLSRAELLRYLPDRSRETLYVDLDQALANAPAHNLPLQDEDQLVVHSVWDATFEESVTVEGEVKRPGEIPLTRDMRVRDLVFKAGGLTKDAYRAVAHLYRTDRATKEVTIHTFALGAALDGDEGDNLLLQDQDNVVIHSTFQFAPQQQVVVVGKVNNPGTYPYATNMRVRDLVLAGGGLSEDAYLGGAEVVRSQVVDGEIMETHTISFQLERAMAGEPDANFPLEPYDKLFVKTIPEWRETRKVSLQGEVTFPGVYYIAKGERLSSVLERAGGFTAEAHLHGAVFTRERARELQQARLDELRDALQQAVLRASSEEAQAALNPEDAIAQKQYLSAMQGLLRKLEAAKATGRVIVKLGPLEQLQGTTFDLLLEDGDTLTVPPIPQTVAVVGQVHNPTSILWDPEHRTVEHYLQLTGGPTVNAETDRMYVVRADGTVVSETSLETANWWADGLDSLELEPGDSVLVPEKVVHTSVMKEIRDMTQTLYQIAITAGVAVLLF